MGSSACGGKHTPESFNRVRDPGIIGLEERGRGVDCGLGVREGANPERVAWVAGEVGAA